MHQKKGALSTQLLMVALLWLGLSFSSQAQTQLTITGKLVDEVTKEPIAFGLIGIDGSSYGAVSDEEGKFTIADLPLREYKLLISHVGYKRMVVEIGTDRAGRELLIMMKAITTELDEVAVTTKKGERRWKRSVERFKTILFGANYERKYITLVNEEVLDFDDRLSKSLKSKKPLYLKIENRHLGYMVEYFDFAFVFDENRNWFKGNTRFTELEPKNKRQSKVWSKNRKAAYRGSIRHFFKSLIENQLDEQDFVVNLTNKNPQVRYYENFVKETEPVVAGSEQDSTNNVGVNFQADKGYYSIGFDKSRLLEVIYLLTHNSVSHIKSEQEKIRVYKSGVLVDPLEITNFGNYASKGVYHMLPINFKIDD